MPPRAMPPSAAAAPQPQRPRLPALACCLLPALLACQSPTPAPLNALERQALADSVLTLFDSLSAIHSGHPDSGILRRLHPPADTLLFIEGAAVEQFTGDSLFRRVLALHVPVRAMDQRFTERRAQIIDRHTAVLTAVEAVHWVDSAGAHEWNGILTLVVVRQATGWVIRAYRG